MQAGQALINKPPWVAVYPAFFADLVNVHQTRVASVFSGRKKARTGGKEKTATRMKMLLGAGPVHVLRGPGHVAAMTTSRRLFCW